MLRRRRAAQINRQSVPYGSTKVEYLESPFTSFATGNTALFELGDYEIDLLNGDTVKIQTEHKLLNLPPTNWTSLGQEGFPRDGRTLTLGLSKKSRPIGITPSVPDTTVEINGWMSNYDVNGGIAWAWDWAAFKPNQSPDIEWHTLTASLSKDFHIFQIDDYITSSETRDNKTWNIPAALCVFGVWSFNENYHNTQPLLGRKKYFKFWFNDKLTRHLIPSIDKTGTPCMFDLVSRKNFYNAGTGQFRVPFPNIVPSDYTQVEYLESAGTQWIDTLNYLNDNVEVQTELQYTNFLHNSGQVNWFYGNCSSRTKYVLWGLYNNNGNRGWAILGNDTTGFYIPSGYTPFDRFIVEHTKDFIKLNGVVCGLWDSRTLDEPTVTKTLYLFARHHQGGYAQFPVSGKMWYFKVLYDGTVSNNYVPCLDSTGTPCMYDTVTQTPYYNAGTGDFLYPSPTSSTTYSMRRPLAEYAKMTNTGVRRLYHVPVGYEGSIEEYASENGFKLLNETESPNEEGKYYAFRWVETDTEITTEWYETEPPTDEFGQVIENDNEQQSTTFDLRRPAPIDNTVYSNNAQWAKMTDTGVHKIYHTPIGYEGSLEDYAVENNYKRLIETESPNEEGKYYSFKWVETDDTLTTEWFEIDPPQEEFFEENLDNPTE